MTAFAEDQPDERSHELPLIRHEAIVGRDHSQQDDGIQIARMIRDDNGAVLAFKMLETGHAQRAAAHDEDAPGPAGHETHRSLARSGEGKRSPERWNDSDQDDSDP